MIDQKPIFPQHSRQYFIIYHRCHRRINKVNQSGWLQINLTKQKQDICVTSRTPTCHR